MTKEIGSRQIIFSVNCFLATILTLFIAFSLDLKSPGWAMTTVYLTSQPISGVMRAKAVYRVIGTLYRRRRHGRDRSQSGRCARTYDDRDHPLGNAVSLYSAAGSHPALLYVRAVRLYGSLDRLPERAGAGNSVRYRRVARGSDHNRRDLRGLGSQPDFS